MKRIVLSLLTILSVISAKADEGMWMISNITERTDSVLKSLGLELSPEELYNPNGTSLNNAIVAFGGFCSGVVVSPNGLIFANHHCGFGAIQEHSAPEHDYLKNGFVAKKLKDELPLRSIPPPHCRRNRTGARSCAINLRRDGAQPDYRLNLRKDH